MFISVLRALECLDGAKVDLFEVPRTVEAIQEVVDARSMG